MNAPFQVSETDALGDIDDFRECCTDHAWFLDIGIIELPIAADNLQWLAERWGLIDLHGQDAIQAEMAFAFTVPNEEIPLAPLSEPPRQAYRTPQSTIDAFWYVVRLDDADYLARWLSDHLLDASQLHETWKRKCPTMAK